MTLDSLFEGWSNLWAPKLLTLLHGPLKPGVDSLADHAALKLGKGSRNLKHEAAPPA